MTNSPIRRAARCGVALLAMDNEFALWLAALAQGECGFAVAGAQQQAIAASPGEAQRATVGRNLRALHVRIIAAAKHADHLVAGNDDLHPVAALPTAGPGAIPRL